MSALKDGIEQLRRYPSAVAGAMIIAFLLSLAGYTVFAIPYGEALDKWRGGAQWQEHPINARPAWVNWFRGDKLPGTIRVTPDEAQTERQPFTGGERVRMIIELDYPYAEFPSELNLFIQAQYAELEPFMRLTWHTPDGREIPMGGRRVGRDDRVSISQDWNLERRLGGLPHVQLLADPEAEDPPRVLPGIYQLEIDAILFEPDAEHCIRGWSAMAACMALPAPTISGVICGWHYYGELRSRWPSV
jgi:peptide/nickel transport system permease protein